MQRVLERLEEAGLHHKTEKVNNLHHTLTAEGVPASKIAAFKEPVKEIQTFLSLVNFYRRHLRNMTTICRPLTAYSEDRKEFVWNPECN